MSSIKRPAKMPEYVHAVFGRNPSRENYYDIAAPNDKIPFSWFRLTDPHNDFLIRQRVCQVAESFVERTKILFTGLRRLGGTLWYEGDTFVNGKKSLVLFHFHSETKKFDVYLFPGHYPRSEAKRMRFIRLFIQENARENSRALYVQSNRDITSLDDAKVNQNTVCDD